MTHTRTTGWAIKWDTTNRLDGRRVYLEGACQFNLGGAPYSALAGYSTMVFRTRQQARDFIRERHSYIRNRPDLLAEPHCDRVPRPVKVVVTVQELS